jgi:hypothetical protein
LTLSRRAVERRTRAPNVDVVDVDDDDATRRHGASLSRSYLGETHGAKAGVGRNVDAEHIDAMWRRPSAVARERDVGPIPSREKGSISHCGNFKSM